MPKFENLEAFVREKYGSQGQLAQKLGIAQNTVSAWTRKRNRPSVEMEKKLRALGFDGPFPHEVSQVTEVLPSYITREDLAALRGWWEKGEESVLRLVKDLDRRVRELERRAGISE